MLRGCNLCVGVCGGWYLVCWFVCRLVTGVLVCVGVGNWCVGMYRFGNWWVAACALVTDVLVCVCVRVGNWFVGVCLGW